MKTLLPILAGIFLLTCNQNPANNVTNLTCQDYWPQVNFSNFCSMELSHFDLTGDIDNCKAANNTNATFPYDELIYIQVSNAFSKEEAQDDFLNEKEAFENRPDYMEVSNLGDDAFAELTVEFGKLDFASIVVVKGNFYVTLEVNGNSANNSNNCLDQNTVFDFARAIVAPL